MKIEINKAGKMVQSGSSLLRMIKTDGMPILDLFVREVIQNSLDAAESSDGIVNVDMITGDFVSRELSRHLERITEGLNRKFKEEKYSFLAVKDTNTTGLDGPLTVEEVKGNNYGNLFKLVYSISKPQEKQGTGGSWGEGKTVYYRIGIGIVIYYSRIWNKIDRKYESRLAVAFVEDEKKKDALIPPDENNLRNGIAWWGEQYCADRTRPITDKSEIQTILDIFGIEPYSEDETGTTIIIPYIDKKKLLDDGVIQYADEDGVPLIPIWRRNLDLYLNYAIQRWYSPRLDNPSYRKLFKDGKILKASINHKMIRREQMQPVFKVIQGLYNYAIDPKALPDILQNQTPKKSGPITVKNILRGAKAGFLAFAEVDKRALGMTIPENLPSPYMYLNLDEPSENTNRPVFCFTRKPGMIVSYEDEGAWVRKIPETDSEHYLFAVFVLNSENELKHVTGYDLEKYIREGERSDHKSWYDMNFGGESPRILAKIQTNCISHIIKVINKCSEETNSRKNVYLGRLFGDLLLPPTDLGSQSVTPPKPDELPKLPVQKGRDLRYTIEILKYTKNGIEIKIWIMSTRNLQKARIALGIETEGGTDRFNKWIYQTGLEMPFEITEADVQFLKEKTDKKNNGCQIQFRTVLNKNHIEDSRSSFQVKLTEKQGGSFQALEFTADQPEKLMVNVILTVKIIRDSFKPAILVEKEGK